MLSVVRFDSDFGFDKFGFALIVMQCSWLKVLHVKRLTDLGVTITVHRALKVK